MGIGKTADVKIISSVKSVVTRRSTVPVLQELVIHTNRFLAAKTLVPWGRLYDLIPGGCALSFYRKIILLFFKQRNYYVMDDNNRVVSTVTFRIKLQNGTPVRFHLKKF